MVFHSNVRLVRKQMVLAPVLGVRSLDRSCRLRWLQRWLLSRYSYCHSFMDEETEDQIHWATCPSLHIQSVAEAECEPKLSSFRAHSGHWCCVASLDVTSSVKPSQTPHVSSHRVKLYFHRYSHCTFNYLTLLFIFFFSYRCELLMSRIEVLYSLYASTGACNSVTLS